MEIDEAKELIIREALRRLGPKALNPVLLQDQIIEVAEELAEAIFANLSHAARQQLRHKALRIEEQSAHLKHINKAIEYGRSLIAIYKVETLGELPEAAQQEFARLWANATGGLKFQEN